MPLRFVKKLSDEADLVQRHCKQHQAAQQRPCHAAPADAEHGCEAQHALCQTSVTDQSPASHNVRVSKAPSTSLTGAVAAVSIVEEGGH